MKFCKTLQKMVGLSDPEWVPFWMNYKLLKKMIHDLPTAELRETGGESTAESGGGLVNDFMQGLNKSPEEVKWFKLLYEEFQKARWFFEKGSQELAIREERLRKGCAVMQRSDARHVHLVADYPPLLAKSMCRLYKDMTLLENFAILNVVAFSKILKKHDSVTGSNTRHAFMVTNVFKSSLCVHDDLCNMIDRCKAMYETIFGQFSSSPNNGVLDEDEQLFIDMVIQMNNEMSSSPAFVGADE